jgi:membrane-associated phospholipid phosphatase
MSTPHPSEDRAGTPAPKPDAGWLLILAVSLVDMVLLAITDFRLLWRAELPVLFGALFLCGLWGIYSRLRPAPRLADLARIGLMFLLYTNAAAVLSYLVTGIAGGVALLDHRLAAADRALGFDWLGIYRWLQASPGLLLVARMLYASLGLQLLLLLLILSPMGRADRAREFFSAFVISSLAVILLGAALPAAGAFVEYGAAEAHSRPYVLQYLALRDGSLRLIDLGQVQGLVQFPSFHAALAALCCYAVRGMRLLFPASLVLNLLVIAATPTVGGHHLIDVIAGLLLAAATIGVLSWRDKARHCEVALAEPG